MAASMIPADTFFKDFSFDIVKYTVTRNGLVYDGLIDEQYHWICFHANDDIQIGDILTSTDGIYTVTHIGIDTYNGKPDLLRASF